MPADDESRTDVSTYKAARAHVPGLRMRYTYTEQKCANRARVQDIEAIVIRMCVKLYT